MSGLARLRALAPVPLRQLASRVLPLPSRLQRQSVSDVRSLALQPCVWLHVYWLTLETQAGPSASFIVLGDEVMRLDCLGAGNGHMHLNLRQVRGYREGGAARLYFREQTWNGQIERACFELENNLPYALATNRARNIRATRLTAAELGRAAAFARVEMLSLVDARRQPDATSAGANPVQQSTTATDDTLQQANRC